MAAWASAVVVVGKLQPRAVSVRAVSHELGYQDQVVAFADQAGAEGVA